MANPPVPLSVKDVLSDLLCRPWFYLFDSWNWKAALFSASIRCAIFFAVNLTSGWQAAWGAALAEFVYRLCAAGYYGAVTQAFSRARPVVLANITALLVLPLFQHTIEFGIHWARGTPKLATAVGVSMCFTFLSTMFNLYSMRRGALIVGEGAKSIWEDIMSFPVLVWDFAMSAPRAIWRQATAIQD